jgi:hypothetical protein
VRNGTDRTAPHSPAHKSIRASSSYPALNALLAVVVANLVLQPLTEPDFGWHLRTGLDLIRQHAQLPLHDPYSYTMPDWPWVEHAWLTDLVIAVCYLAGGALGVILLFGVVTAGAWLLAARCGEARAPFQLLACILSLSVALPFLGARTQFVTVLGLALLMWLLERIQKGDEYLVWCIPPLFLLWGNLHGGFTAGLFFVSVVLVLSWLLKLRVPEKDEGNMALRGPLLWKLAVATGAAATVTLANPYGWRLHQEIFDSLSNRFMIETLQEWQPLGLDTLAGKMFLGYTVALAGAMVLWYRRVEAVRAAVLLVFLFVAVRNLRNVPLFLILSVPLLAELLETMFRRISTQPAVKRVSARAWTAGFTLALGIVLFALGPEHLERVWAFGVRPEVAFRQTSYPIEAIEWIHGHRDRLGARPIHDYRYGGFMLWWLPGVQVFIDGRMPAWRIGDRYIFADYMNLCEADPPHLDVLDKYGVDWALLRRNSPLARALAALPGWQKEYEDAKVMIYRLTE